MAAQAEPDPPRARVIVANINAGHLSADMVLGVINSLTTGRATSFVAASSGPYLDAGRNKAVVSCLRATTEGFVELPHAFPLLWDWLLFIDSDIEFRPDHIDTLFAPTLHPDYDPARLHLLAGVYVSGFDDGPVPGEEPADGHFGPVVYEWVERDDLLGQLSGIPTMASRRISKSSFEALPPVNEAWNPPGTEISPSPVCEVAAVGTGFMGIHISLIREMQETYPEPMVWFDEPVINGVHYGEDFGFCYRVRDMGYPVLVNRACKVIHHKTTKLI
jgi:hypothetical protein